MLYGIIEFLGWFGAVTVLAGYILFSTGKLPNGPLYQSFNLVGGLAVAVNVAAHHAIPSTIVNGIWAVVAAVVLVRTGRARRAAKRGLPIVVEEPALLVEPPTTTAVLPVVGPALRDHEAEATDVADAASRLRPGTATTVPTATDVADEAPRLQAGAPAEVTPTAAAPMTESIPVITATIALALVAAAQEHAEAHQQEHTAAHQQEQTPAHQQEHTPHDADSATA